MHDQYIPDVKAYRLDLAKILLEDRDIHYYVIKTVPVRSMVKLNNGAGLNPQEYRVIRQRVSEDGILELIVAREAATL